jgi:hypothetical protein
VITIEPKPWEALKRLAPSPPDALPPGSASHAHGSLAGAPWPLERRAPTVCLECSRAEGTPNGRWRGAAFSKPRRRAQSPHGAEPARSGAGWERSGARGSMRNAASRQFWVRGIENNLNRACRVHAIRASPNGELPAPRLRRAGETRARAAESTSSGGEALVHVHGSLAGAAPASCASCSSRRATRSSGAAAAALCPISWNGVSREGSGMGPPRFPDEGFGPAAQDHFTISRYIRPPLGLMRHA